jgi:hypothetical protein
MVTSSADLAVRRLQSPAARREQACLQDRHSNHIHIQRHSNSRHIQRQVLSHSNSRHRAMLPTPDIRDILKGNMVIPIRLTRRKPGPVDARSLQ